MDPRTIAQRLALAAGVLALAYTAVLAFVAGFTPQDTYAAWLVRKLFPGAYLLAAGTGAVALAAWMLGAREAPRRERPWDAGYWSR